MRTNGLAFKLTVSGTLTAAAIIIAHLLTQNIPIFGIPGLRISFHGPFLQFISVIIGPVFGGMAYAIRDLVGFLLGGEGAFLWQLMIVDFCCGVAIGFLWYKLKNVNVNVKWFTIGFGVIFFCLFLLFGVLNLVLLRSGHLLDILGGVSVNAGIVDSATWGLISTGLAGLAAMLLCHVLFHFIYRNSQDKDEKLQRVFRLLIAVGIPTILVTFVNSFILYRVMGGAPQAFVFFMITRLIRRVFTVFYDVYILTALVSVYEQVFKRQTKRVAVASASQDSSTKKI